MWVGYVDIIVDCWIYIRGIARYLACAKTRLLSMENSVTFDILSICI